MMETLVLGVIAGYFIWRLYSVIGEKRSLPGDKIRLVSPQTGEVLEMKIIKSIRSKDNNEWDDTLFLTGAKMAFQKTMAAFSVGDLKTLKDTLSSDVYATFERDILSRRENGQTMEFSLVCFDAIDILSKTPDNAEVTVQFKTEQINLLKNAEGQVIEGDKMSISTMKDVWVFRRIGKESWIITATQSQVA